MKKVYYRVALKIVSICEEYFEKESNMKHLYSLLEINQIKHTYKHLKSSIFLQRPKKEKKS